MCILHSPLQRSYLNMKLNTAKREKCALSKFRVMLARV